MPDLSRIGNPIEMEFRDYKPNGWKNSEMKLKDVAVLLEGKSWVQTLQNRMDKIHDAKEISFGEGETYVYPWKFTKIYSL